MKARYTKAALKHIAAIVDHIHQDNPSAATDVRDAIQSTIDKVVAFPSIGSDTDRPDILMIPARPYTYLIFYIVTDAWIIVRYVRHPKRRRPANRPV
jgi:plasmid stabilization system protein ParE